MPLHPEVDYVVVARHPLDAAVSLSHQGANRRGRAGAGRAVLDDGTVAAYRARMADLLDPDLDAWLHQ